MLNYCPLCHHKDASLYSGNNELRSGGKGDVYICSECGLLYPKSRMDEGESGRYITESYKDLGSDKWADLKDAMRGWRLRRWRDSMSTPLNAGLFLKSRIVKKGKALDIGTFAGEFCEILNAVGFDSYGIEPYSEAVEFARNNGLRVYSGSFPDNIPDELRDVKFKLITMLESIYYFVDLKKSFKAAYDMLDSGGYIFIKCHQGNSPYYTVKKNSLFKRYGDAVQGIPTLKFLKHCLNSSGYDITHISGTCYRPLSPVGLGVLTSKKNPLRKAFVPAESLITRFYESYIMDIDKADRIMVLAKKREVS